MSDKIANDFIHVNGEYEKLKKGKRDDTTPRETPSGQGPGGRGYDKAQYKNWTDEELEEHAVRLNPATANREMRREALIELIKSRDATAARMTDKP